MKKYYFFHWSAALLALSFRLSVPLCLCRRRGYGAASRFGRLPHAQKEVNKYIITIKKIKVKLSPKQKSNAFTARSQV